MELGLDISTLAVAVIAGGWTYWTWKKNRAATAAAEKAERDRQARRDELDDREYRKRDIAEAHAIHKELTSRDVFAAMQRPGAEPDRSYLAGLHKRLEMRLDVLLQSGERASDDNDGVDAFAQIVSKQLDAITEAIADPLETNSDTGEPVEAKGEKTDSKKPKAPSRDFTKYSWEGIDAKLGKGGALSFIGARFAQLNRITTVEDFIKQFGDVMEQVLSEEISGNSFKRNDIISPLLHEGQRERYAVANRRWRDAYGSDGVITLDGTEYLIAWSLGFRGTPFAEIQKKLIAHFEQDQANYPITEIK